MERNRRGTRRSPGSKIAWPQRTVTDDDALKHDPWINRPDMQRVIAGPSEVQRKRNAAHPIAYSRFPVSWAIAGIDDCPRAIVH